MYKRIATSLVAAAVGGVTLMAASPAMAHPKPTASPEASPSASPSPARVVAPSPVRIVSLKVTPDTVVIKGHDRVSVTATAKTVNAKAVSIDFQPKLYHGGHGWSSPGWNYGHGKPRYGKDKWDSWDRTVSLSRKDSDGPWIVTVTALGYDGKRVQQHAYFNVKHVKWDKPKKPKGPRLTRIVDFDAGPEPVRKYRKLTLSGKLQSARCNSGWYFSGSTVVFKAGHCGAGWHDWRRLAWKDIHVFFQKKGSRHWKYVDTISTNPDGSFYTKVRAYTSGTWKVVYKGDRGLQGSEAVDYVKVIR